MNRKGESNFVQFAIAGAVIIALVWLGVFSMIDISKVPIIVWIFIGVFVMFFLFGRKR